MILSGRIILARSILTNLIDSVTHVQPCSVDLTLESISAFTSLGTLDFSNALRQTASTGKLSSSADEQIANQARYWDLTPGSYIVEFNELLATPLDCMGHVYPRSSLWRSGAVVIGGVCDAGYRGALGALLQVSNPQGLKLYENAWIAQAVFHEMGEGVGEGYTGTYQGAVNM